MGFFVTGKRGTLRGPLRFNATDACLKLFQGMKGIGTDEAAIISVVSAHTSKQRQQIRKKYTQIYKKDLMKELDGELSFTFGRIVAALMTDPEDYTLECIHKAVVQQSRGGKIVKRLSALFHDGLGKTEYSLLSLLCPRTNKELMEIKEMFQFKYQLDLEEMIALGGNDLPQDFCTFILDILGAERDEEDVNDEQVEEDLDSLLETDGSNEEAFQEMLIARSFPHMKILLEKFMEESGRTLEDFVDEASFSAELKDTFKGVVMLILNEPVFYADRLKQAIKGAGTDDETLIRILVLRSEVDLLDIIEVYENKFGVSLEDDIAGDTSGDYKDILMKIIAVPVVEDEKKETRLRSLAGAKRSERNKDANEEHAEGAKIRNRRKTLATTASASGPKEQQDKGGNRKNTTRRAAPPEVQMSNDNDPAEAEPQKEVEQTFDKASVQEEESTSERKEEIMTETAEDESAQDEGGQDKEYSIADDEEAAIKDEEHAIEDEEVPKSEVGSLAIDDGENQAENEAEILDDKEACNEDEDTGGEKEEESEEGNKVQPDDVEADSMTEVRKENRGNVDTEEENGLKPVLSSDADCGTADSASISAPEGQ